MILGDSNLCATNWDMGHYQVLANMVQDYLLETTSQQLVTGNTRAELVGGLLQNSCIDHCYSDVREKITGPFGARVLKYCRTPVVRPQTIRRRVYKNFSTVNFLKDIFYLSACRPQ